MDRYHAFGHHSPVSYKHRVFHMYRVIAVLLASEPASNEQGLRFSRVQGALR